MFRRLIISGCIILAAAGIVHADYNPEVKTKGSVSLNELVVFVDESGRWIKGSGLVLDGTNINIDVQMAGDVSGAATNATVIRLRKVPIAELDPGASEDGYGLKYDHATGTMLLGPVATEGTTISNLLTLSGTATNTDVAVSELGMYRIIRPGNLPSMALNVGGYEAAYFDLTGITLKAGSINLLSDFLTVNPAAYDGSAAAPAYTWDDDRDLGKYRFSYNGDYAEGFAAQSNLVWFWAADGIHLTNGAAMFGASYNNLSDLPDLTETDPLSLHTSGTYTAWSPAGGTYTQEAVFATSPLLTNGYSSISYDSSGWSVVAETSSDSNTWSTAVATNTAVYLRLRATNNVPPGETSLIISNIAATSWTRPATWGTSSDTIGQNILVDIPTAARQAANKQYTDNAVAGVAPSAWAQYVASTNVRMNGKRLIMTDEWTLTQTGGVGIISYADVWATTNALTIAHNGIAVLTAVSGITGLQIDDYSIAGSNVTLWVSTNGVVSEPLPQYTADLLAPDWSTIGSYTSTYPTVTNSAYKIDFDLPDGDSGFFRAVQNSGGGSVNVAADLTVQGVYPWKPQSSTNDAPTLITPRWIGDELIIHTTTNMIYRSFGTTTNDWEQSWP